MGDVVYTSHVRIEQQRPPHRTAHLPVTDHAVHFGTHGAVAEHYGNEPETQYATTLDYVIAAAAG